MTATSAPTSDHRIATVVQLVHRRLLDIDPLPPPSRRRQLVIDLVHDEAPLLDTATLTAAVDAVTARVDGMGPLEPLLDDPTIAEVLVNGAGPVWIERHGRLERTDIVLEEAAVNLLIERVVGPLGRRVDRSSPTADGRLPDGSRVHIITEPIAVDGPHLCIRRFGTVDIGLDELTSPDGVALLAWLVGARANAVVSGASSSGKTTLLNALGARVDPGERVLTIEDAAELRWPGDHVVRLEARPANAEGVGQVTIRELVRHALRMRPDRLVVGEIRGAEALDLLQAMNTGHTGSLSTVHANGPADALRRLESLALFDGAPLPLEAVRAQIASAVDVVVQMDRGASGVRQVREIAEVVGHGSDGWRLHPLFVAGRLVGEPQRPLRHPAAPPPPAPVDPTR